jgi:hypothetical protein
VREGCSSNNEGVVSTPSARADGFDNVDGSPNRGDIANPASVGKGLASRQDPGQDLLQTAFRCFDHAF